MQLTTTFHQYQARHQIKRTNVVAIAKRNSHTPVWVYLTLIILALLITIASVNAQQVCGGSIILNTADKTNPKVVVNPIINPVSNSFTVAQVAYNVYVDVNAENPNDGQLELKNNINSNINENGETDERKTMAKTTMVTTCDLVGAAEIAKALIHGEPQHPDGWDETKNKVIVTFKTNRSGKITGVKSVQPPPAPIYVY